MKTIVNALPIGTVLDSGQRKYRIVKVLGQGGFGITYQAVAKITVGNIEVDVPFAIKEHFLSSLNERQGTVVTTPAQSNAQEVKDSLTSFLVEAERLNRLSISHKGLVRVNESFRANDTAYYVMEYISGQNLRQLVAASADHRLSETDALRLIGQVADAVGYLHQNQVTHLDIKPDNILLREDGTPVLIDFGLAKHYDRQGHATSSLKVAGCSDGYAPLEQYAGIDRFTPEADVYALTATLLFLLTGKDPRKASDITEQQIRQSLPDDVSEPTRSAIVHGMQKLQEMRTQTIEQFQKESKSAEPVGEVFGGRETKKQKPVQITVAQNGHVDKLRTKNTKRRYAVVSMCVLLLGLIIFLMPKGCAIQVPIEDCKTFTVNGVSFNMIRVDSPNGSFYIGETEVTQELWLAVMGNNPSYFKGDNLPVEQVNYNDCVAFIKELNKQTGYTFRLPTNQEWGLAAQGGDANASYEYSGSDDYEEVGWFDENSEGRSHPVKEKRPNQLGIYDMSGNVAEWCEDFIDTSNPNNIKGVSRGGSWYEDLRTTYMLYESETEISCRISSLGLRLAL